MAIPPCSAHAAHFRAQHGAEAALFGLGFHPLSHGVWCPAGVVASGRAGLRVPLPSGTEPTTKPPLLASSGARSHPIINLPYPKPSIINLPYHRKCCLPNNTQAATEAQTVNSSEGLSHLILKLIFYFVFAVHCIEPCFRVSFTPGRLKGKIGSLTVAVGYAQCSQCNIFTVNYLE